MQTVQLATSSDDTGLVSGRYLVEGLVGKHGAVEQMPQERVGCTWKITCHPGPELPVIGVWGHWSDREFWVLTTYWVGSINYLLGTQP